MDNMTDQTTWAVSMVADSRNFRLKYCLNGVAYESIEDVETAIQRVEQGRAAKVLKAVDIRAAERMRARIT